MPSANTKKLNQAMSEMESDMRSFLAKIATSVSMIILWMLINITIGIGYNFAFFNNYPKLGNYLFYAGFLVTLFAVWFYLRKKWRKT